MLITGHTLPFFILRNGVIILNTQIIAITNQKGDIGNGKQVIMESRDKRLEESGENY